MAYGRWGERWASDREQAAQITHQPYESGGLVEAQGSNWRPQEAAEEMWDLEQFGAPTYGPGL
jgi:hypothetical protein